MVAYKLLGDKTVSSHLCGYQKCKRCTDIHIQTKHSCNTHMHMQKNKQKNENKENRVKERKFMEKTGKEERVSVRKGKEGRCEGNGGETWFPNCSRVLSSEKTAWNKSLNRIGGRETLGDECDVTVLGGSSPSLFQLPC